MEVFYIVIKLYLYRRGRDLMLQVSRTNNLKVPKTLENTIDNLNSVDDKVAVKQALATANNQKFNKNKVKENIEKDGELERIEKIPFNANDLMVITVVKKLGTYIIAVTEKSPAKYRGVFVNRMQNLSLEILELLLQANFVRIDCLDNKKREKNIKRMQ